MTDPTKAGFLSPTNAAYLSKQARGLLMTGQLTAHQFAVFEVLLWSVRKPGADNAVVAYDRLRKLTNTCRQTIADAITAFERLGLLRRIKRKVLVLLAGNQRIWRQAVNQYVFLTAKRHESAGQTENPKQEILLISPAREREAKIAQESLAAIAAARMRTLGFA